MLHATAVLGVLAAALLCASEGVIPTVPSRYVHLLAFVPILIFGVCALRKNLPFLQAKYYNNTMYLVALMYIVLSISAITTIGVSSEVDRMFPITPVWMPPLQMSAWPLIFWRMGLYSTTSLTVLIVIRNFYVGYIHSVTSNKDT